MTNDIALPGYKAELFRNRTDELREVDEKIEAVHKGENAARTLYFVGDVGQGKSWLAFHLHAARLAERSDVQSFLYCLEQPRGEPDLNNKPFFPGNANWKVVEEVDEKLLGRMLEWTIKQLEIFAAIFAAGEYTIDRPSLRELSHWLYAGILEKTKDKVLVFLFDGISTTTESFRDLLEQYLLAPLTKLPNVLLILLGRGPMPKWTEPKLELEAERYTLGPLPEGNALLVALDKLYADPQAAQDRFLQEVLAGVPSKERNQVKDAVLALSAMESFRDHDLPAVWQAYQDTTKDFNLAYVRQHIKTPLLTYQLVRWSNGAYHLDAQVREVAGEYLASKEPKTWSRLLLVAGASR